MRLAVAEAAARRRARRLVDGLVARQRQHVVDRARLVRQRRRDARHVDQLAHVARPVVRRHALLDPGEHGRRVLRPARRAGRRPRRAAGCRRGARAAAGARRCTCAMRKKRSLRKRPAFISAPRSRRVAARTRTSIGSKAVPPTRLTCFSLSARRSLGCSSSGSSPSSSRKSVPPCASASAPLRRSVAPVNGALLVAEEDALGQRRRDAAAVDDHERRPSLAVARVVDGLGDELLAGARLAQDEHATAACSTTFSSTPKTRRILRRAADERPEAVGEARRRRGAWPAAR